MAGRYYFEGGDIMSHQLKNWMCEAEIAAGIEPQCHPDEEAMDWAADEISHLRSTNTDLLAACRIGAGDGMDGDLLSRVAEHLREEANQVEDAENRLLASWLKEDADLLIKKQVAQAKAIAKATRK